MPRKHPIRRCARGRLVSAGRSTGAGKHAPCLICETAAALATCVYPPRRPPASAGREQARGEATDAA